MIVALLLRSAAPRLYLSLGAKRGGFGCPRRWSCGRRRFSRPANPLNQSMIGQIVAPPVSLNFRDR